jgi:hypothetical protein
VLYSQLEDEQEGEYEETSQPEYEDQEHHLDHQLEDVEMNDSNVSGCDWDEKTYLHKFTIPLLCSLSPEPGPSHVPVTQGYFRLAQETDSKLSMKLMLVPFIYYSAESDY